MQSTSASVLDRPTASPVFGNGERANRLKSTRFGGKLVNDYWDNLFRAKEQGKKIVWYNGTYIPPFFHSHDVAWVHGEAWSAHLAAKHAETPAQQAGEARGYDRELCSYARTHIGQALLDREKLDNDTLGLAADDPRAETMRKLPLPDMIVNAYPYCSTGQQWDDITYRMFGKKIPMFTIQIPLLWGGRPDAGYMRGAEWNQRSKYVADQLVRMTRFMDSARRWAM
jgi:benzoyl-CoA reductase subunit B